ncbi:signal peptide peptidase SppA [Hydrogenovibrio kuenenii]|uniref:signal peptide peptidase SppA n=1 Tax=Hydrogenovibrio kuenenii TaxID=63658 RepID=UPI0004ADE98C|nr:signal peptide peptidase SppA [Hydrogenovibrio kuenenii]
MKKFKLLTLSLTGLIFASLTGCATIKLGPSYDEPLKQQVIESEPNATAKVLLINVNGVISDQPQTGLLSSGPSLLDRVMMQLKKAEKDKKIKTVLLKINTPGGGVTTSDILYHELMSFKKRTGKKIYVQMMDVTASGGYYISMAADHIQAHPTTVTGSVGVITILPEIYDLTQKIGVEVKTYKTGPMKDTGSPFRKFTPADDAEMQSMVNQMAQRFYHVVQSNRHLSPEVLKAVKTARIYVGKDALKAGLVDSIGYLSDAVKQACQLGGDKACDLVSYRFDTNVNATSYSPTMQTQTKPLEMSLIKSNLLDSALSLKPGSYYLYLP